MMNQTNRSVSQKKKKQIYHTLILVNNNNSDITEKIGISINKCQNGKWRTFQHTENI
jgi:hypothetical protein